MSGSNAGLRNSLQILSVISEHKVGVQFTELKKLCGGLSSGTLSRLLKVIIEEGWCEKGNEGFYHAAGKFRLAADNISGANNRESLIQNRLIRLAESSGESAALVNWNENGYMTFRNKHEMPESYHYLNIGKTNNSYAVHGFGMIGVAYSCDRARQQLIADYQGTEQQRTAYSQIIMQAREDGIIMAQDKGIRIASPVLTKDENFVGVCGISLLPREITDEQKQNYFDLVKEAARDLGSYF